MENKITIANNAVCSAANAVITKGVAELGIKGVDVAVAAILIYDDFLNAYRPSLPHHLGAIEIERRQVWFKIDRYTEDKTCRRLITLLLPDEY